ncbi:MAG: LmeA family phospholipid-binding protein [Dermatophilaceae bacterium]
MNRYVGKVLSWSRRPRVRRVLIPVAVVAAILLAEVGGRAWAAEQMRDAVIGEAESDGVEVDVGRTPVVWQALTGGLDRVELTAEFVWLGPYIGPLDVVAEDVSVLHGATGSVVVRHPMSATIIQVQLLEGENRVRFEGESIVVSGEVGDEDDPPPRPAYELRLGVVVDEGTLKWVPQSLRVDGRSMDVTTLDKTSLGGAAGGILLDYVDRWCFEQDLPQGLELTGAEIRDGALALTATGTEVGGPRRETCNYPGNEPRPERYQD